MSDITLSAGIRDNLLSLQNSSELLQKTQVRLSTGKKVNTALDDPLKYFEASGLNATAGNLSRLLDGIDLGVKTLESADNGIRAIQRLVETAQGGARSALSSNATNARLGSGMDPVSKRAIDYLQSPNLVGTPVATAPAGKFNTGDQLVVSFTVPPSATVQTITATFGPGAGQVDTAQELATFINTDATNNNVTTGERYLSVSIDAGGRLLIDNTTTGTLRVQLTDAGAANTLGDLFGLYEQPVVTSTTTDTGTIAATVNATRANFASQYNDLLAQITNLAKDSGFNGTNLLYGQSLNMVFDDESKTSMIVHGVVFDATGLNLLPTDTRRNFQSDAEINAAIDKLSDAIKQLRAQAAAFAANNTVAKTRQEFTKQAIKALTAGADGLVTADLNEEGANLLALQTRQALSTQALSLASQSEQAILRLFG